jgi:hypothetical protein
VEDDAGGPARNHVLFLAVDATGVDDETIATFADQALAQGAAYVCIWGPDCERVHDIFDRTIGGQGSDEDDDLVTTTWHADDTLDEALWFAVFVACPHDPDIPTCGAVLTVVAGRDDWAEHVRTRLTDPRSLLNHVAR